MKTMQMLGAAAAIALAGSSGWAQTVESPVKDSLYEPVGIAVDTSITNNTYYITDSVNQRIVSYSPGLGEVSSLTGPAFDSPFGIVLARGGLVVADYARHTISFVDLYGGVTQIAGSTRGYTPAATAGLSAQFNSPAGVTALSDGTIFVADSGNGVIRRIDGTSTNGVTVYATGFRVPSAVAAGEGGRLFVADTGNHVIKLIETDKTVKVIAGTVGSSILSSDLNGPRGLLWVGGSTGLLVSDTGNHRILRLSNPSPTATNSWVVSTYSGAWQSIGSTDGALRDARFHEPMGMAVDLNGSILIADDKNNSIRRVVRPAVKIPVMTPPGGSFSNDVAVVLTSLTTNAFFRYTTDGSEPTLASPLYSGGLTFTKGPVPLRVRAFSPDLGSSEVISNSFGFFVDKLVVGVAGGAFTNDVYQTVSTATRDIVIRYSTNSSVPTATSPVWGNQAWGVSGPLKFKAFRDGFADSDSAEMEFKFTVATPVITPPGPAGPATSSNEPLQIAFSSGTSNVVFYWTMNKVEPSNLTGKVDNGVPFTLETNGLVRVKAYKVGYADSSETSATFNLQLLPPVVTPSGDLTRNNDFTVSVAERYAPEDLYYTLDGSVPTTSSTPYTGPVSITQSETFKVKAFYKGMEASPEVSANYSLVVADPVVTPASLSTNQAIVVNVSGDTTGADFYYTTTGEDPTVSNGTKISANPATIPLAKNCTFKLIAIKAGYKSSGVITRSYSLQVAKPTIVASATQSDNVVSVTLAGGTTDSKLYYTTDGTAPSATHGTLAAGNPTTFTYGVNGTLKVIAVRDGFVDSEIVSQDFALKVGTPVIAATPDQATVINTISFSLSTSTVHPNTKVYYTLDGSAPSATHGTLYTGAFDVTTNATLKVIGVLTDFASSDVVTRDQLVQVDTPGMLPLGGFFPDGTTISFTKQRADAVIHYTLDGTDPKETSPVYSAPFVLNALNAPGADLKMVKAQAFAPGATPSKIVSGQPLSASKIGIPRSIKGGPGATVVLPVVVTVKSGDVLRSLQYNVEVYPEGSAPNLEASVRALNISTNDFVLPVSGTTSARTFTSLSYSDVTGSLPVLTNVLSVFMGPTNNLLVDTYATVTMLALPVPSTAKAGDVYHIGITYPSGTSDGFQAKVALSALPDVTLTVQTNVPYTVGDSSPGFWYNIGDFGDGELDNADVNAAFHASLGDRIPYPFTDVFDAMDVFPTDTATTVGGDGQIRYLDWQYILMRALRKDLVNWEREWISGGVRSASSATLKGSPDGAGEEWSNTVQGSLWPDGKLIAGSVGDVQPGAQVSVPVYLDLKRGSQAQGLQTRVIVEGSGIGAALPATVVFEGAAGMPDPVRLDSLPANEASAAWSPLLNPLAQPLVGKTLIGNITFRVPQGAVTGQSYKVQLSHADGAANMTTPLALAGVDGVVKVGAPAPETTTGNPQGFRLVWNAPLGQKFSVESSSDLVNWTSAATGLVGRGRAMEYLDSGSGGQVKFYRIKAQTGVR